MKTTLLAQMIEDRGYRKNWIAEKAKVHYIHFYSVCSGSRPLTRALAERCADIMQLATAERVALIESSKPDGRIKNGTKVKKKRSYSGNNTEPKTLLDIFTGEKPLEEEPIID